MRIATLLTAVLAASLFQCTTLQGAKAQEPQARQEQTEEIPTGTWTHRFDGSTPQTEDYRAYLVISLVRLEVWAVDREGYCAIYPSEIQWENAEIMVYPETGNTWEFNHLTEDQLRVHMPDTTVTYRRSKDDPHDWCDPAEQGI